MIKKGKQPQKKSSKGLNKKKYRYGRVLCNFRSNEPIKLIFERNLHFIIIIIANIINTAGIIVVFLSRQRARANSYTRYLRSASDVVVSLGNNNGGTKAGTSAVELLAGDPNESPGLRVTSSMPSAWKDSGCRFRSWRRRRTRRMWNKVWYN